MIDIHCHILPKVDDGPHDVEEAHDMVCALVATGTDVIVATPHNMPGMFETGLEGIRLSMQALGDFLVSAGTPVRLLLGQEITFQPDLLGKLQREELLTLNGTSYFLFELPPFYLPPGLREFVFEARLQGLFPILAHPERNDHLRNDYDFLEKLIEGGMLVQLTASSIFGRLGRPAMESSEQIIRRKLVHFIASDCHSMKFGPDDLNEAVEVAAGLIGESAAGELVEANPLAVIEDRPLPS